MATDYSIISGAPARIERVPTVSGTQRRTMREQLEAGRQNIQDPFKGFDPIAQQARSGFEQRTIPGLLERLTGGMGGSVALSSPVVAGTLGQAGAGFEENLAALRAQFGQQNKDFGLRQLGLGLQPEFQNLPVGREPGALEGMLPQALQTLLPLLARAGLGYATGGASTIGEALLSALGGISGNETSLGGGAQSLMDMLQSIFGGGSGGGGQQSAFNLGQGANPFSSYLDTRQSYR